MKKLLLSLALLTILAPVTLAQDAADVENLNVEVPAPEAMDSPSATAEETVTATALDSNGLPVPAIEVATETVSASYECPSYTIYCRRDSQCDSYCGAPGAGACEFGCCACTF